MDADVEAQDQQPNYNGDDQDGSDGCSATDRGNVSALIQPERTAAGMPDLTCAAHQTGHQASVLLRYGASPHDGLQVNRRPGCGSLSRDLHEGTNKLRTVDRTATPYCYQRPSLCTVAYPNCTAGTFVKFNNSLSAVVISRSENVSTDSMITRDFTPLQIGSHPEREQPLGSF